MIELTEQTTSVTIRVKQQSDRPCRRWRNLWRERSRSLGTGRCWSPSWWCSLTPRRTCWSNPSGLFYSCPSWGRPRTFYCRHRVEHHAVSFILVWNSYCTCRYWRQICSLISILLCLEIYVSIQAILLSQLWFCPLLVPSLPSDLPVATSTGRSNTSLLCLIILLLHGAVFLC